MSWPFHDESKDGLEFSPLPDFWMGMLIGIAFSMGAIFAVFAWILSA